ncbi:hypothetical protein NEOCIP111885_03976 [Pseudoneobacillus rhizosphaerae]|uniref:Uncharacterized protein n=1 Tax=Pseudoneobacillus rhizosphaerae TaxID=2880968 RepID=A0A9C7LCX2_9BACI|nr:hypothetical protein NEOCIP111885_03976 [Pseudoneobacillus rhizosphaerae]
MYNLFSNDYLIRKEKSPKPYYCREGEEIRKTNSCEKTAFKKFSKEDYMQNKKRTIVGTDIDEVKRQNAASGLSYNDVKLLLAQKHLKK